MIRSLFARLRNERGASLAFVAVTILGMLSVMALAIDLGMLYKTRGEAQRAADAAALAGASAFIQYDRTDPVVDDTANARALDYAQRNYMTGGVVVPSEVTVQVITDSAKVRVWVRRAAVQTWFARIFGVSTVPIGARAAAEATQAGEGTCVKPFAIPDYWDDPADDIVVANKWMDNDGEQGGGQDSTDEQWDFDPLEGDRYERFEDDAPSETQTGLGSDWRNDLILDDGSQYYRDQGRPIVIKQSDPQASPQPGYFYPFVIPGTPPGGAAYRENIWECSTAPITLNADYNPEECQETGMPEGTCDVSKPGNMIGPTKQGLDSLIAQDPGAHWVEEQDAVVIDGQPYETGHVEGSSYGSNWLASPRVVIVPMMDPNYIGLGRTQLRFNNLALIFIEDFDNRHKAVVARYIGPAPGTDEGPVEGSLIKFIRLVE
jgi:hypothetical protein